MYEWYDLIISHIPESVSTSVVKERLMTLFETKINNNICKDYKPKNVGALDDKYVEYKSERDKSLSIE